MSRSAEEAIKLFGITNQLLEHDLDRVEREFAVDLQRQHVSGLPSDEAYYPQIEAEIRADAARMAPHYEVFYSLETTIRTLIAQTLQAAEADQWWDSARIPDQIRNNAEVARKRDLESGMTPRSDEPLLHELRRLGPDHRGKLGPVRFDPLQRSSRQEGDGQPQHSPRANRALHSIGGRRSRTLAIERPRLVPAH